MSIRDPDSASVLSLELELAAVHHAPSPYMDHITQVQSKTYLKNDTSSSKKRTSVASLNALGSLPIASSNALCDPSS